MPLPQGVQLAPNQLNDAYIDINASYQVMYDQLFGGPENWANELLYDHQTDQDEMTVNFFLPEFGLKLGQRHGGVSTHNLLGARAVVGVRKFEQGIFISKHDLTQDRLGLYMQQAQQIAQMAAYVDRQRILDKLINGNSSAVPMYDGENYFSNSHPIGAFTYDNLFAGVLNAANLQAALTAMNLFASKSGPLYPMNIMPTHLVVPPQLQWTARELLHNGWIARDSAAGVFGSVENVLLDASLKLIVAPELGADSNDWYLVAARYGVKPYVRVTKKGHYPFFLEVQGMGQDKTLAWEQEFVRIFGWMYMEDYPTHPFFALKVVN